MYHTNMYEAGFPPCANVAPNLLKSHLHNCLYSLSNPGEGL